ncbi:MAG: pilus assembly protein TadG-related protein, partial [Acidobacteriota bacterium]|nr:pilus assembly protein TadG-related protein [Acidobacteriota bacterium]
MDIRNPISPCGAGTRACRVNTLGAVSIQLVVIMVPVIFGMMGFAVDLGRLYLIRGELNQAANAMALAAASKLIGTTAAIDNANTAAQLTLDNTLSNGNKYNFGSLQIGQTTGILASDAPDPSYFSAAADAAGPDSAGSGNADGTTAKYAQANITADAPLTFWALLSLGQMRKTQIAARAVAGVSAPLCTACGIEPFAIAPIDATDTTDFGFTVGTQYTFGYVCNGLPVPQALAGSARRIPFLLLDRYDTGSTFDESQQLYRTGAQGVIPSPTLTQACFT